MSGGSSVPPQSPTPIPGVGQFVQRYNPAGDAALTVDKRLVFARVATSSADSSDFLFRRQANYSGGKTGYVCAAISGLTTVAPGTESFEWTANFILDNSGTSEDRSENLALAWSAIKRSTGRTLAGFGQITDLSGPNPGNTSVVTEFDIYSNGGDKNENRIFLDLQNFAAGKGKGGTGEPGTVSHGIRAISSDGSPITNGYTAANGVYHCFHGRGKAPGGVLLDDIGQRAIGVNLSAATYSNVAVALGKGQAIAFDFADGVHHRALSLKPGGQLAWTTSNGDVVLISDDGQIQAKGDVTVPYGAKIGLDASIGAIPSRHLSIVGDRLVYTTPRGAVFGVDDGGSAFCANDFTSGAKIACKTINANSVSDPASPGNGDLWYNSEKNTLHCYVNGAVKTIVTE
jgi:hypothetical protein